MRQAPLLIFGFDAGDPEWLVRWAQEGHLPALANLLERGCWARTTGPELISEHGVWVPLLSGVSRYDLGYYYFRQLKPGSYDLQPITGLDLKFAPLWAQLPHDKRIAVFDVPEVFPTPGLPGIQLANWGVHLGWKSDHPAHQLHAEPPSLLNKIGPRDLIFENANCTPAQDHAIRRQLLARVAKKGALVRNLLGREHYDLMVVVFTETHTGGHQFWKYRHDANSDLHHAIRDVYQATDRELGQLLAQLPAETNVIITSSVGLEDYYPTGGLTEAFCRQLGYQVAPAPGPVSWKPLDVARRVLPEFVRVSLSRRLLSRDQREQLVAEQFRRATDWTRTTAFAIPTFYAGLIRVNLRGREPQGIVAPGAEYEALLDRLEVDLRQLTDPVTGAPAVGDISRPGRLFRQSPPAVFPDLWIEWSPSRRFVDRVHHPRTELTQTRPEWCRDSDHCRHGFVAAAGPAIAGRGALPDVSLLDLAPTFLTLLDEPVPAELPGRPLATLLS